MCFKIDDDDDDDDGDDDDDDDDDDDYDDDEEEEEEEDWGGGGGGWSIFCIKIHDVRDLCIKMTAVFKDHTLLLRLYNKTKVLNEYRKQTYPLAWWQIEVWFQGQGLLQ